MEDDIVKYGTDIQGVFVHWDNGATGVIQAAKAAGIKGLFIVGVDGNRAGYYQVQSGDQAVSIAQDFVLMTKTDLGLARDVLAGKKVQPINFVPLFVVDKNSDRELRSARVVGSGMHSLKGLVPPLAGRALFL